MRSLFCWTLVYQRYVRQNHLSNAVWMRGNHADSVTVSVLKSNLKQISREIIKSKVTDVRHQPTAPH